MVAMNDLARQISDKKSGPRASEHVATVIGKDAQGTYWVSIPGGAERTPVATALIEASAGDTVMVAISDGRCIMSGNVSSPSASTRSVSRVGAVANMAMTTAYSEKARIDELSTTALTAQSALITELQADTAKVHDLTAEQIGAATAYVGTLSAGDVTAQDIIAAQGTIESLDSEYAHITNGVIDNAEIGYADVNGLDANYAHLTNGVIDNATIGHANVGGLSASYAQIDAANINSAAIRDAWVNSLLVQTGLIANEGTIFKLAAIQVDASSVTTGTLDVRRLIVTRTVEGVDQKYLVEIDPATSQPTYVKMDGDVLGPQTVAANKLVAHSITAEQLTIQNIVGTGGWINLASGTFAYGNPLTGQGITWDGTNLGISGSVTVGASSKALSDMLTADDVTVTQNQTQTGYDVDIAGNTFSLVNGETGPTAQWYYGTALTHTSGTATLATSSTAGVVVGAMYLNKDTSLCYKCTAISSSTATWTYAGNLTDGVMDNINVGGRNLARNTSEEWTELSLTGGTNQCISLFDPIDLTTIGVKAGDFITVSFDIRFSDGTTAGTANNPQGSDNSGGTWHSLSVKSGSAALVRQAFDAGGITRINTGFTVSSGALDGTYSGKTYMTVRFDGWNGTVYVRKVKVEKGNIATDWTPAPEDQTAYVDALSINSTNLVRNGDFVNGTNYWAIVAAANVTGTVQTDSTYGRVLKAVQSTAGAPSGTECRIYPTTNTNFTHVSGETYSLSFYAKAAESNTLFVGVGGSVMQVLSESIGTSWKRYTATYTATANGSLTFYLVNAGTLFLTRVMVVHGDKPMDWSIDPRDAKSDTVEYIVGTQTEDTNAWTGVTSETTLVSGKNIAYYLPHAGNSSAATLNLTLATGSTTGAKNVRINNSNVTTHFPANSVINLTYDGTYWKTSNYNDSTGINNARYRTQWASAIKAETAITASRIICGTASGYKNIAASATFDLAYPLLYSTAAIAAGSTGTGNYLTYNGIDASSNGTITAGAANKMLYLKGTVNGNTFTIASSGFLTTNVPTTDDGFVYIPLGVMYSATNIYFSSSKELYAYIDGKFRQVTPTEIVATQRIYWRTATSGTPSKPSSWVTATSNSYASWTTKVPPLSSDGTTGESKYPYLYTCEQRKRLDGTVECTAVLLDDSTTIIDGGSIITNSVTANKLDTIDLNASHAITIGAFDYETSNTINDAAANATQALQDASDAAKTATNFITESGVNDMLLTAGPQAYRVRLTSAGMEILNPDGDVVGFHGSTIQLGSTDGIYFEASETRLAFRTLTQEIAYFGLNSDGIWQMHIATTYVDDMIRFGDYAWIKRNNGNMSIKWLGE